MNLSSLIYAQTQGLPPASQQEVLDLIMRLKQQSQTTPTPQLTTQAFLARIASCQLSEDFPDDIDDSDLAADCAREELE